MGNIQRLYFIVVHLVDVISAIWRQVYINGLDASPVDQYQPFKYKNYIYMLYRASRCFVLRAPSPAIYKDTNRTWIANRLCLLSSLKICLVTCGLNVM